MKKRSVLIFISVACHALPAMESESSDIVTAIYFRADLSYTLAHTYIREHASPSDDISFLEEQPLGKEMDNYLKELLMQYAYFQFPEGSDEQLEPCYEIVHCGCTQALSKLTIQHIIPADLENSQTRTVLAPFSFSRVCAILASHPSFSHFYTQQQLEENNALERFKKKQLQEALKLVHTVHQKKGHSP